MTITELVLLILNTTRSMCNVERAPYYIAIQLQLRPIN